MKAIIFDDFGEADRLRLADMPMPEAPAKAAWQKAKKAALRSRRSAAMRGLGEASGVGTSASRCPMVL